MTPYGYDSGYESGHSVSEDDHSRKDASGDSHSGGLAAIFSKEMRRAMVAATPRGGRRDAVKTLLAFDCDAGELDDLAEDTERDHFKSPTRSMIGKSDTMEEKVDRLAVAGTPSRRPLSTSAASSSRIQAMGSDGQIVFAFDRPLSSSRDSHDRTSLRTMYSLTESREVEDEALDYQRASPRTPRPGLLWSPWAPKKKSPSPGAHVKATTSLGDFLRKGRTLFTSAAADEKESADAAVDQGVEAKKSRHDKKLTLMVDTKSQFVTMREAPIDISDGGVGFAFVTPVLRGTGLVS
jgi:hypothetical protein